MSFRSPLISNGLGMAAEGCPTPSRSLGNVSLVPASMVGSPLGEVCNGRNRKVQVP